MRELDLCLWSSECALPICVADLMFIFFFFNDTATTEIYTLSLHDALPISRGSQRLSSYSILKPIIGARSVWQEKGLNIFRGTKFYYKLKLENKLMIKAFPSWNISLSF